MNKRNQTNRNQVMLLNDKVKALEVAAMLIAAGLDAGALFSVSVPIHQTSSAENEIYKEIEAVLAERRAPR